MSRCIVTCAAGAHEELLDVALPGFERFATAHGYDLRAERNWRCASWGGDLPPAWSKVWLLLDALNNHEEVVWLDCDLIIVDASEDFPPLKHDLSHAMVRHFDGPIDRCSEVPNTGVWRLKPHARELLEDVARLEVFADHGWWEQAAVMTMMGYSVPPQGSDFKDTRCRCVRQTKWQRLCQWMRLQWNSHPNYRADRPRIVHCSYPDMPRRLEVMRALARDPGYDYPRFNPSEKEK